MLSDTDFDPFTTENLVNLPEFTEDKSNVWSGFRFEAEPPNELLTLAQPAQSILPKLTSETLQLDISEIPLHNLDSSALSSDGEPTNGDNEKPIAEASIDDGGENNFWCTPDVVLPKQENKLISWDHIISTTHEEPVCTFVTEAGSAGFDLLIQKSLSKSSSVRPRLVRPDVFTAAIFDLGLGRSSRFFVWHDGSQRFEKLYDHYTLSGLSPDTLSQVEHRFLDAGARLQRLRTFAESRQRHSPSRYALQTVANSIIGAIEDVVVRAGPAIRSLIQLKHVFEKPFLLIDLLHCLVKEVMSISEDVILIRAVSDFVDRSSVAQPQFERILHMLFTSVMQPVLRIVEISIGLRRHLDVHHLSENAAATALLTESSTKIYHDTKTALHLLREEGHYDLLNIQSTIDVALMLAFSSEEISLAYVKAETYEHQRKELCTVSSPSELAVVEAVNHNSGRLGELEQESKPFSFDPNLFADLSREGSNAKGIITARDQTIHNAVIVALTSNIDVTEAASLTCTQAMDVSIGPLLRSQHRLLSYSVLQILFSDHKFLANAELLGRFQLLSHGTFASRLSLALFDSEEVGMAGTHSLHSQTGLRLQNRDTWPPATSELRLALMSILSESMPALDDPMLAESLSFAIRDLSDEDLERCREIDSIHALDFLRLSYKPPSSCIAAVITRESLDQYDRIFNQLLKLLRIKTLAQSLLKSVCTKRPTLVFDNSAHKLTIEAQQFITAFADYCHNAVIRTVWLDFETKLHQIHAHLERRDYHGTHRLVHGLAHLREMHDNTVDRMLRGLLLKNKQSEAKGIVDRLFEVVLRFAALMSSSRTSLPVSTSLSQSSSSNTAPDAVTVTVRQLRQDFEGHVRALVRWLKLESSSPMSSSATAAARTDSNESRDMFEQLLLRLDWNGYWSRE